MCICRYSIIDNYIFCMCSYSLIEMLGENYYFEFVVFCFLLDLLNYVIIFNYKKCNLNC